MRLLKQLDLKVFSLDSITDLGKRMVVDYRGTSYNGSLKAFEIYEKLNPKHFVDPKREPLQITIIGYGGVGRQAMYAFGDLSDRRFSKTDIPGAKITILPISITKHNKL